MKIAELRFDPMDTRFSKVRGYLSSPVGTDRDVAYTAVAIALVDTMLGCDVIDDDCTPASIVLTCTDTMNEIAIIDRAVFGAKLKAMLDYRMDSKFNQPRPFSAWETFFDFIGFTAYFSVADIELINTNFLLFREAYSNAAYAFKTAFEELED